MSVSDTNVEKQVCFVTVSGKTPVKVVDIFADIADNKVPVRVANLGLENVWLIPKVRLGVNQRVEVVKTCTRDTEIYISVNQSEINVSIQKMEVHIDDSLGNKPCTLSVLSFKVNMGNKELTAEETSKVASLFQYKDCF